MKNIHSCKFKIVSNKKFGLTRARKTYLTPKNAPKSKSKAKTHSKSRQKSKPKRKSKKFKDIFHGNYSCLKITN